MTALNGLMAAAEWILQTSIKASVLIGFILLVQWILRNKLSGRWRYALWLLLIVRMLLPFSIESKLSIFNLIPLTEKPVVSTYAENPRQLQSLPQADYRIPVSTVAQSHSVENTQSRPGLSSVQVLTIIWFLGVCIMAISTFFGNLKLWRQLRRYHPVTDKKILNQFERCKLEMHVSQDVELAQLKHIRVPALYGILKPKILLPDKVAASFKMTDLTNIFYHELAHLKRRDIFVAWITTLLQIFHWFNPVIWFAFFRIRMDRELACDELTLKHVGIQDSREYGRTLLSLLNHVSSEYRIPITVGILETKSNLRNRMKRIAQFNKSTLFGVFTAIVILVGLACFSLTEAYKRKPYASEVVVSIGADDTVRINDMIVPVDSLSIYLNKYRFDENSLVTLAPEMNVTMGIYCRVREQLRLVKFNRIKQINAESGESFTTQYKKYRKFLKGPINIEIPKKDEFINYGKHDRDTTTAILVDPRSGKSYFFHEGLAAVLLDDKWGFINRTGRFLIEPIYDEVMFFTDGLAPVKLSNKWGYVNRNGNIIVDFQYDRAFPFHDGFAEIRINSKCGFIDKTGNIKIEPVYDSIFPFSEGLAQIRINGKCGYINK